MGRLTAIPVGQGDAFLLVRADGRTVLVDGGRGCVAFPGQVAREGVEAIDVVVCTHADADHAKGLIGLLEASEVSVREVWLPGRWTSRLASLCRDQLSFLRELLADVHLRADGKSLEEIAGEDRVPATEERAPATSDLAGEIADVEEALAESSRLAPDLLDSFANAPGWWPWLEPDLLAQPQWELWVEAVQTAARIRAVARAARHHGARIRWFDFDEASRAGGPSGGEPFLRPLNARELTSQHALRKIGALRFLALSVANRESLVFIAPQSDDDSAVLFTADSDMACGTLITGCTRTVAVTAPHHGSDANSAAYPLVRQATLTGGSLWVRSDGNYSKRPGTSFLGLPAGERACTLCRGGGSPKRAVRLADSAAGWQLTTQPCNCK